VSEGYGRVMRIKFLLIKLLKGYFWVIFSKKKKVWRCAPIPSPILSPMQSSLLITHLDQSQSGIVEKY
jgi:hypothetical protein